MTLPPLARPPYRPPAGLVNDVKRTEAARPAFPVRLRAEGAAPSLANNTTKLVASPANNVRANALKSLNSPGLLPASGPDAGFYAARQKMVQQLARQGLQDTRVLDAMAAVERHRFVDTALASQGYVDTSLPIGLGQTISKPNVVARMLELLCAGSVCKLGRVLEIGTGCGYQAALLSQLAQEVYSMERLRGLHEKAIENLRFLRLPNVHLLFGDGMAGYPRGAPYAAIIAAAGGEAVPPAWIEQLAVGGRLVAPVQSMTGGQTLVVVEKTRQGVTHTVLEAVHFVPLKSGVAL